MRSKTEVTLLAILMLVGVGLSTHQMATAKSKPSSLLPAHDVLVGAAASPAMGMGNGTLLVDHIGTGRLAKIKLAHGVNAFQVAIVGDTAYVPTLQGRTYIVNLQSNKVMSHFTTPVDARIATTSADHHLLIIVGTKNVTAYALPSHQMIWQTGLGGNALAIVGNRAYLSGNTDSKTTILDVKSGKIITTLPIGNIEDSVYDAQTHSLWLANWNNGDMTVLNTRDNHVVKVIRENEGGGFSMHSMMSSMGGFMQLAVAPTGKQVYASSFSGNIMVYNAAKVSFEKNIPIAIPMAKLSGIAIDPSGQYAYTTVESAKETVRVSLQTGKMTSTYAGLESNRWNVIRG